MSDKPMSAINADIDQCCQDIRDLRSFLKWCDCTKTKHGMIYLESAPEIGLFTKDAEIKLKETQGRLKALIDLQVNFRRMLK